MGRRGRLLADAEFGRRCGVRPIGDDRCRRLGAAGDLGNVAGTRHRHLRSGARSELLFGAASKRESVERALVYMGLEPGRSITEIELDRVFIGSCTNARIEDLRVAAAVVRGRKVSSRIRQAMVVPGSGLVKRQAEQEGLARVFLDAGFEWRRSRMLDVSGDERRPARNRRAMRRDLEPELRGAPGTRRPYAPRQSGDGRRRRGGRSLHRRPRISGSADMKPFTTLTGTVVPLDRANVDTDQIIPKQFLKSIRRSRFRREPVRCLAVSRRRRDGTDAERATDQPQLRAESVRATRAPSVLLARANFGCGSSREHAVWALEEYGIRCVICAELRGHILQQLLQEWRITHCSR